MPSATPPITIRLPEATRSKVDRFAKMTKRSRSFIINEAVEQYLQDRFAYLEDLDGAVASLDTQPTYSADEVFIWMSTWGTRDEKPLDKAKLSPGRSCR